MTLTSPPSAALDDLAATLRGELPFTALQSTFEPVHRRFGELLPAATASPHRDGGRAGVIVGVHVNRNIRT